MNVVVARRRARSSVIARCWRAVAPHVRRVRCRHAGIGWLGPGVRPAPHRGTEVDERRGRARVEPGELQRATARSQPLEAAVSALDEADGALGDTDRPRSTKALGQRQLLRSEVSGTGPVAEVQEADGGL